MSLLLHNTAGKFANTGHPIEVQNEQYKEALRCPVSDRN